MNWQSRLPGDGVSRRKTLREINLDLVRYIIGLASPVKSQGS
ncbi:MAG: hypothetical protein [Olavius algarvensis Gamma 3 endosymbiont]|nr:MAG: hypothetical protein [Olavius algarvensis Gamma 3 endosymbiont]